MCGDKVRDSSYNTRMKQTADAMAVLTFDDATRNHRTFVAPLLREYGFGATFFITRFPEAWRKEHGETLLTPADLRELHAMGFELGNHTWSHEGGLDKLGEEVAHREFALMEEYFRAAGVPHPEVYAYPCNPYAAVAEAVARARGYLGARSFANRPWRPAEDNPFRIPAYGVCGDFDKEKCLDALHNLKPGEIPVFLFHGVPDRVHPWVNTEEDAFRRNMDILRDGGFRVVGLGEALRMKEGV